MNSPGRQFTLGLKGTWIRRWAGGRRQKTEDRKQEQKAVAHHLTCVGATAALLATAPRPGVTGAVGGGRRCLGWGMEGVEGGLVSTWGLGWKEGREVS